MIIALSKDQRSLIIGLSKMNLERLQERRPARSDIELHGQPLKVIIMYGETEFHIENDLREVGLLPPLKGQ